MKTKVILAGLGLLTLVAVSSVLALRHQQSTTAVMNAGVKTFVVRGQVRSLDLTNRTVRITHEAIPDYMPAMTMPFEVKDVAVLNGLAPGDEVQFELAVTDDDSWIARVQKLGSAAPAEAAAVDASAATLADREAERVQVGETVPDFQLVDQDGRAVRLSDYRGRAVVLTFIYTRCPLPNFCPLMSKHFAELEQRLNKELPGRYHLLSISMDPEFDTPAVLKEYASRYEARTADWTFATGDAGQIDTVAQLLGLYYVRENGLISHDLRTALIGPDGRLVHLWKSNVWTPYEVQRRVRETLTGSQEVAVR
ncbi:MAG TPA: SCO family protein [Verrucomicrobiae bacterium]|nr:SCO family protein [Verrucomicrobiae bacterium]